MNENQTAPEQMQPDFCMTVKDNSMKPDGIHKGDLSGFYMVTGCNLHSVTGSYAGILHAVILYQHEKITVRCFGLCALVLLHLIHLPYKLPLYQQPTMPIRHHTKNGAMH